MAMVKQYPHYLFAETAQNDATQDANGNWVEADTPGRVFVSMCREETDGRGGEYQVAGGTFRTYTATIHMPKSDAVVAEGTRIFVANDSQGADVRFEGIVKKFDKGQLHNRIWA